MNGLRGWGLEDVSCQCLCRNILKEYTEEVFPWMFVYRYSKNIRVRLRFPAATVRALLHYHRPSQRWAVFSFRTGVFNQLAVPKVRHQCYRPEKPCWSFCLRSKIFLLHESLFRPQCSGHVSATRVPPATHPR